MVNFYVPDSDTTRDEEHDEDSLSSPQCEGCDKPATRYEHGYYICGSCDGYKVRGLSWREFL